MDGLLYHNVVKIRGMDQILGVVKLDSGFDVSNLNTVVFVEFLRSIVGETFNERLTLSHCC